MTLRLVTKTRDWNTTIQNLPYAHILQTAEWGDFKQRSTGWTPDHILVRDQFDKVIGGALVLIRQIGPLAVMYVPKGPMLDYADSSVLDQMLAQLERLARRKRAIWLKIDPDVIAGTGVLGELDAADQLVGQNVMAALKRRGWRYSDSQVQFRNTILIDLTRSEDELLAAMGQGKRRKVRYGPKHGVTVRAGTVDDLPLLYKLYAETGKRDGFITRPYDYYADEWGMMLRAGLAHALIAEVKGTAVAHVILFHFGRKCWYFYGASVSDNEARKLMPTDLLQWEAMHWAKAQGYTTYDMWGAPNTFTESDPMWGVYQFKRDFGGTVARYIGAWDYVPFPPLYALYSRVMPRILDVMRGRARKVSSSTQNPV
ncbi:MAG: peptidoglycan bridge formation glycyltransferase FemA/FemB family protein [Anaerolineae bacterium]|nr:peptidoglycan bridge formation glycyltransferase FemA/FemB family protein [Anaerolineae bacterium]